MFARSNAALTAAVPSRNPAGVRGSRRQHSQIAAAVNASTTGSRAGEGRNRQNEIESWVAGSSRKNVTPQVHMRAGATSSHGAQISAAPAITARHRRQPHQISTSGNRRTTCCFVASATASASIAQVEWSRMTSATASSTSPTSRLSVHDCCTTRTVAGITSAKVASARTGAVSIGRVCEVASPCPDARRRTARTSASQPISSTASSDHRTSPASRPGAPRRKAPGR